MATRLLTRGLGLAAAVAALAAVALRLQQQPLWPASSSASETYCYHSILTQDKEQPSATCFTIANGLFADVSTRHVSASGPEIRPGHVIPGLWDGHGHLLQYGEFLDSVDLFGSASLDDVRARVAAYVAARPGAGTQHDWIRGVGWDQTAFGRMPTAVSCVHLQPYFPLLPSLPLPYFHTQVHSRA